MKNVSITPQRLTPSPNSPVVQALSVFRDQGALTRAELARILGISKPTASALALQLTEKGLLAEHGKGDGALGRRGTTLSVIGAPFTIIGVLVDVRQCTVFACDSAGNQLRDAESIALPNNYDEFLNGLSKHLLTYALPAGRMPSVYALTIPGVCNDTTGEIYQCPNMRFLDGRNLCRDLEHLVDHPVVHIQEIRAIALGSLAAVPGIDTALCVDIGEGVGGAVILDKRVYRGRFHAAGEIGHSAVAGAARSCGCGRTGCLETVAAVPWLLAAARERFDECAQCASFDQLVAVCPHIAQTVFSDALVALAHAVTIACRVLDPDHVVIHGKIWEQCPGSIETFTQLLDTRCKVVYTANARRSGLVRHVFDEYITTRLLEG